MLKRIRWMLAGLAVGFGGSLWARRKVRAVAARYGPAALATSAASRVRDVPGDVRAALQEGREAMRQREAELRQGQGSARSPRQASGTP